MLSQSAVPALQKVISVCTTWLTTTADMESVIVLLGVELSAACLIQIGISQSAIPTLQKVISLGTTWLEKLDIESFIVLLGKGCLLLFHCFAKGDESLHIQLLLLIWNLSQPKGYLLLPN